MRKRILMIAVTAMLICCVSCAAKQEETAEFTAPTPAVETPAPTPTPEPIPTEKPYSAFNEKLAGELTLVKPISC